MKDFVDTYSNMSCATRPIDKIRLLSSYLHAATHADCVAAVKLLAGIDVPLCQFSEARLLEYACDVAEIPGWMVDECSKETRSKRELIALLACNPAVSKPPSLHVVFGLLHQIRSSSGSIQKDLIIQLWQQLDKDCCLFVIEFLLGKFRPTVSQHVFAQAVSTVFGISPEKSNRLLKEKDFSFLTKEHFEASQQNAPNESSRVSLSTRTVVAYKNLPCGTYWQTRFLGGHRCLLETTPAGVNIYDEHNFMLNSLFPEIVPFSRDTAVYLEGELLGWKEGGRFNADTVARRLTSRKITLNALRKDPAVFVIHDMISYNEKPLSYMSFEERRRKTDRWLMHEGAHDTIVLADARRFEVHDDRQRCMMEQEHHSLLYPDKSFGQHFLLYSALMSFTAVVTYVQISGRAGSLKPELTFSIKGKDGILVPVLRHTLDFTSEEYEGLLHFVKHHTIDRFGPVRSVHPLLQFQIRCGGISASRRKKCGFVLQAPFTFTSLPGQDLSSVTDADYFEPFLVSNHE